MYVVRSHMLKNDHSLQFVDITFTFSRCSGRCIAYDDDWAQKRGILYVKYTSFLRIAAFSSLRQPVGMQDEALSVDSSHSGRFAALRFIETAE